jgi:electron transport complex protein RnfD
MDYIVTTSPHTHGAPDVGQLMRHVLYALIPGILVFFWFFGWGILINLVLASLTAVLTEALILRWRKRPLKPFLTDYSAIVTACLLALALPPLVPWWLPVLGTAFAIVFAKQLYGGLGNNPFNPAMVGYAVLLISFPVEMTRWPAPANIAEHSPDLLNSLSFSLSEQMWTAGASINAFTGATPLDQMKTALAQKLTVQDIQQQHVLFSSWIAHGWQWLSLAYLLGGFWLLYQRVISWHIPVAVLSGLALMASVFYLIDSSLYPSPLFHLFTGATLLGAFFIATDPVSAATSNRGRLFYGLGIGILVYIIRTWGGYPDGMAFAVLLMNMAVPAIDAVTQPRVFGR